ncbi:alpha/beta hydrolase [Janibacter sp. DB-40]|uniref:alpha/beta fold hydrolase n=1 Tax=Janibacter sp. DB-40 TaxID=3028808 RepID=UPI002405403A|nr:alpha/beta hydrolase [Janibacter sp. DB-40]
MKSTIEFTHLPGPGEPVVLIHGIGHRRQAWGEVPRLLNDRGYDVYVVDLPGHGTSPTPTRPDGYTMRSTAEQLERLFASLGVDRPHVVGNSLGGAVALELAHAGAARTATVLSPAGFFPVHHLPNIAVNLLFMKLGSYLPEAVHRSLVGHEWFRRIAFRSLYTHPETITVEAGVGDTLNLRRSKGFWPHFVRATFLRFTKDVQVPTTVAWGDTDRLLLPSEAHTARRRLPGATHVTLPDSGHCPQHDHPELVVDVVSATINRVSSGAMESAATQRPAG